MSAKKSPEAKVGSITPFGLPMPPDLKSRIEAQAREYFAARADAEHATDKLGDRILQACAAIAAAEGR